MNKPKTFLYVVGGIFFFLFFLISILFATIGFYHLSTGEEMSIAGHSLYAPVERPDQVPVSSAVLAKNTKEFPAANEWILYEEEGSVLMKYYAGMADGSHFAADEETGEVTLLTPGHMIGVPVASIPLAGSLLLLAYTELGTILFAAAAFLFLILFILVVARHRQRNHAWKLHKSAMDTTYPPVSPALSENYKLEAELEAEEKELFEEAEEDTAQPLPCFEELPTSGEAGTDQVLSDGQITLSFAGSHTELSVMTDLISKAMRQHGQRELSMELTETEPPVLQISCHWKDLSTVSTVVSGVARKLEEQKNTYHAL